VSCSVVFFFVYMYCTYSTNLGVIRVSGNLQRHFVGDGRLDPERVVEGVCLRSGKSRDPFHPNAYCPMYIPLVDLPALPSPRARNAVDAVAVMGTDASFHVSSNCFHIGFAPGPFSTKKASASRCDADGVKSRSWTRFPPPSSLRRKPRVAPLVHGGPVPCLMPSMIP
jgi:hypothetical protein